MTPEQIQYLDGLNLTSKQREFLDGLEEKFGPGLMREHPGESYSPLPYPDSLKEWGGWPDLEVAAEEVRDHTVNFGLRMVAEAYLQARQNFIVLLEMECQEITAYVEGEAAARKARQEARKKKPT